MNPKEKRSELFNQPNTPKYPCSSLNKPDFGQVFLMDWLTRSSTITLRRLTRNSVIP